MALLLQGQPDLISLCCKLARDESSLWKCRASPLGTSVLPTFPEMPYVGRFDSAHSTTACELELRLWSLDAHLQIS